MSRINTKNIPKSPGVYQFFDKTGKIIYIGKSVNLFSRVNSYFNGKSTLNFAKQKMVEQINDIKTIITKNETESLILETNLIKSHHPKYNILMKDDKNYLYIKITSEEFPKITKTRIKTKSWIYFGPYIHTAHVNNILKIIKQHFWYGCYGEHFFLDGKKWYNLDKYIFKNHCNTASSKKQQQWEYLEQIENIKSFLKWDFKKIISQLEGKMKQYAKNLRFEEAQKIKLQIESLKTLEINQNMRDSVSWNYHIIHYLEKFDSFFIGLTQLIEWKIVWFQNYEVKASLWETPQEILTTFVENIYSQDLEQEIKISFILPCEIQTNIDDIIVEIPKIGSKKELLQMTYKNVYEYAYKKYLSALSTKWFTKKDMLELLNTLWYKQINKNIIFECNDISHLSGTHTVASRSIIENGKSHTNKYKKFNIKTLQETKIDDFWAMREVMSRRIKEIQKSWIIPDLIIIDGGKWQLSSVLEVIEKYKNNPENPELIWLLNNLQLVSLAKREEELFLPDISNSILLDTDSTQLRMVQKIRDEAHRFAITFNRDKRIKSMKKNILESLPGFWPITRKKILKSYGSIDKLSTVSETELLKIINISQLETLRDHGIVV